MNQSKRRNEDTTNDDCVTAVTRSPSPPSSPPHPTEEDPPFRVRYDVFLNFHGEDSFSSFVSPLYDELLRNDIRTYRHSEGLNRTDEIGFAIEGSSVAIVVISKSYPKSKWCLKELAKIVECGMLLLPVFYDVDPSDVRSQKETFENDFLELERSCEAEDVKQWRNAMFKAGGTAGYDSRVWRGEENRLIKKLVKEVLKELHKGVAKYPIGIASRVQEVMKMMDVKLKGVRMLGLHGMGGIGKTTLAKAVYNRLVIDFKRSTFISNVRDSWKDANGSITLQRKLILGLADVDENVSAMKKLVDLREPVLIVLDDVDEAEQLDALANREWFYEGSRLIITTRDERVLREQRVDELYNVKELNSSQSLQLLSYHAFGIEKPADGFMNLSKEVFKHAGGLPLALEVFGSLLHYKRDIEDWLDALQKLKRIGNRNLHDVLKISYDALNEEEQSIFLDIACFFAHNVKREDATDIFRGCGFDSSKDAIETLKKRSLLRINEDGILSMHDQLRDMGRQIVQKENIEVGMRSRLWDRVEVVNALEKKKVTRAVQGLVLNCEKKHDLTSEEICWFKFKAMPRWSTLVMYLKEVYKKWSHPGQETDKGAISLRTEAFEPMVNLRLLQINRVKLDGMFKFMPHQLKWLQWKGCPLKYLPRDLCLKHIAILDLSESNLIEMWGWFWWSWSKQKLAENLLALNLHDCYYLTTIPDLSKQQKLEKLVLEKCVTLTKIHKSIGDLGNLLHLNMKGCSSLVEFPSDVSGLKNLKELYLSECTKLTKLPEDIGYMKSLKELLLDYTAIAMIPDSICHLKELEKFSVSNCRLLKRIPPCIGKLTSLRELKLDGSGVENIPESIGSLVDLEKLSLSGCTSLTALPYSIGDLKSLEELILSGSAINEIPSSIGDLKHLKKLSVSRCRSLKTIPDSIKGLASLTHFWLEYTSLEKVPEHMGDLKMLVELNMGNCKSLKSLPGSIGSLFNLTDLSINDTAITELPESFGELQKLNNLRLHNCKQLKKLPTSFGQLKLLRYLYMTDTSLTELPEHFGMLSSLQYLKMSKSLDSAENPDFVTLPKSFSNLSNLLEFDARNWKISGNIDDSFENLSHLEALDLSQNSISRLPTSLRGLSCLKSLSLPKNRELKVLPQLPKSLVKLNVANCVELESIHDLKELESLQELNLTNCKKITDVPGLEHLKSLHRLFMGGCNACFPALKKRLAKVALKHLQNLCVPASDIPDWFVNEIPSFEVRRNNKLKAVLIAVVVSLDQNTEGDSEVKDPAIVDIQARIVRFDAPVFTTTLYLLGVPDTKEDQLFLCRYKDHTPLILLLKEGDKLQLALRDIPRLNGLKLKKFGFHLVYEHDDDNDDDDEEWLDESNRSASYKIAKFFSSL